MKEKLFPITRENFEEVTKYVQKFAKKNAKGRLLRKIIVPVSSILFLVLSFLMTYGCFYSLSSPDEMIVFAKMQKITEVWNLFSAHLIDSSKAWYINLILCVLALYLIPFAASLVIAIIVNVVYMVKQEQPVADNTAKELHMLAQKANSYHEYADSYTASKVCAIIYVVALAVLLIYAFILIRYPVATLGSMVLGMVICLAIVYFLYKLLFKLSYALNSLLCKTKYVPSITSATDTYWVSVDPEEKKRRKEEAARLAREAEARRIEEARMKEQAAAERIRALELERDGQYARAKELFYKAARGGDALGMDNYARHCVIAGNRSDAIYWLQKSIDTGEADDLSRQLLAALKSGQHIDAHYN